MKYLLLTCSVLLGCSGNGIAPIPPDPQPEASVPPAPTFPPGCFQEAGVPDATLDSSVEASTDSSTEASTDADLSDGPACNWVCDPTAGLLLNTCTGGAELDCAVIAARCSFQSSWCALPGCQVAAPAGLINYQCLATNPWLWLDDGGTHVCSIDVCPIGDPCVVNIPGVPTMAGTCQPQ